MISCPKCGAELNDGVKFCGKCGTPIAEPPQPDIFCTECGTRNPSDNKFCLKCGKPLNVSEPPAPVPEPAPVPTPAPAPAAQPEGVPVQQPTAAFAETPKKGSAKLVIVIAALAAVIVALILVIIFLVLPKLRDNDDGSAPGGKDSGVTSGAVIDLINEKWKDTEPAPEYDFDFTDTDGGVSIVRYKGNAPLVRVPDTLGGKPVVLIAVNAFSQRENMESVYIPVTVTELEPLAFTGCPKLGEVFIPDSVVNIGSMAFAMCDNISVTYKGNTYKGNNIRDLYALFAETPSDTPDSSAPAVDPVNYAPASDFTFSKDGNVVFITGYNGSGGTVYIPETIDGCLVMEIRDNAFSGCDTITGVVFPSTLRNISGTAFTNCKNLREVTFLSKVLNISGSCFMSCGFNKLDLSCGVLAISGQAFADCPGLTELIFREGSFSISGQSFINCSALKRLVFECGSASISGQSFLRCSSLTDIEFNGQRAAVSGQSFLHCAALKKVVLANGTTTIDPQCFNDSTSAVFVYNGKNYSYAQRSELSTLLRSSGTTASSAASSGTTPSVDYKSAADKALSAIKKYDDDVRTQAVSQDRFPINSPVLDRLFTLAWVDYNNDGKNEIYAYLGTPYSPMLTYDPGSYGIILDGQTFKVITLSDGYSDKAREIDDILVDKNTGLYVTHTSAAGNYGYSLSSYKCERAGKTTVAASIETSMSTAECPVTYTLDGVKKTISAVNDRAEYEKIQTTIKNRFADPAVCIKQDCITRNDVYSFFDKVYSTGTAASSSGAAKPAQTVTYAPASDFEYADYGPGIAIYSYKGSASTVYIPRTINGKPVTEIGDNYADGFRGNKNLKAVYIPDTVTSIDSDAFADCTALSVVDIPSSVTSISAAAFEGTPWLKALQKKNPLVVVNGILIDGSTASGAVTVPNGVKKITDRAFRENTKITSVIIPDSVTEIGEAAFMNCSGLKTVKCGNKLKRIDAAAFAFCSSLTDVTLPDTLKEIGLTFGGQVTLEPFRMCQKIKISFKGKSYTYDKILDFYKAVDGKDHSSLKPFLYSEAF